MPTTETTKVRFSDLNLPAPLISALNDAGYESPSPIQARAIPLLLEGLDVLGHAPTGTGKTAAFALPLLARLDPKKRGVQIMVLTPTRELAQQVAAAFESYAKHMQDVRVLTIYGGQAYGEQIRGLKRGVQVVVGTPGRVVDHIKKGTLKFDDLQAFVLDEADEMLRMGFKEEVEEITKSMPAKKQMALFSATMPKQVERIAKTHMHQPKEIFIKSKTATAETIRQRYWLVNGVHKLDALTRLLETEDHDAILVFVRTKSATTELSEKLEARGLNAAAMNGDMAQNQREQMVGRLKKGSLDILVATDVAARGLDVERISHVINYDIPFDTEAYIHRIGRTGRAGRTGEAILFVAGRERRMLKLIERATRQPIAELKLPTIDQVNKLRIAQFKQTITDTLQKDLTFTKDLIGNYLNEQDASPQDVAAALAAIAIGKRSLLLTKEVHTPRKAHESRSQRTTSRPGSRDRSATRDRYNKDASQAPRQHRKLPQPEQDQERFRIEVGHDHEVKPSNIVGAIANEAGLDSKYIGHIHINTDYSLIDLPKDMPNAIFKDLKKTRVCGQMIRITRLNDTSPRGAQSTKKRPPKPNKAKRKPTLHAKPGSKSTARTKPRTRRVRIASK